MRKAARKAAERARFQDRKKVSGKRDESAYNKDGCEMRRVESEQDLWDSHARGLFYWATEMHQSPTGHAVGVRALMARFPDGSVISVLVLRHRPDWLKQPTWDWDGNENAPTLTPSVHIIGHWHGWVRAGQMVSC